MKTIKTKKSVGKAYVFSFSSKDKEQTSNSNISKEIAEKSLEYYTSVGFKCSEISEVELFETIEEQVPHVFECWYFVVCGDNNEIVYTRKKKDLAELETIREQLVDQRFECSEIKLLREEF